MCSYSCNKTELSREPRKRRGLHADGSKFAVTTLYVMWHATGCISASHIAAMSRLRECLSVCVYVCVCM